MWPILLLLIFFTSCQHHYYIYLAAVRFSIFFSCCNSCLYIELKTHTHHLCIYTCVMYSIVSWESGPVVQWELLAVWQGLLWLPLGISLCSISSVVMSSGVLQPTKLKIPLSSVWQGLVPEWGYQDWECDYLPPLVLSVLVVLCCEPHPH